MKTLHATFGLALICITGIAIGGYVAHPVVLPVVPAPTPAPDITPRPASCLSTIDLSISVPANDHDSAATMTEKIKGLRARSKAHADCLSHATSSEIAAYLLTANMGMRCDSSGCKGGVYTNTGLHEAEKQ